MAAAVAVVLGVLAVGAIYQAVALRHDRSSNPPPGLLVDVGGYRMHLDCTGQGSPTVIFDSGLGDTWLSWYKVQPAISQFARVCSYDRAGLGWSDASPGPRTSRVIAEELHTLLQNAKINAPYVIVGHSFGGFDVRMYNALYPDEVVGMVLVDATYPYQYKRFSPELTKSNNTFLRWESLRRDLIPFGIARLAGWCGQGAAELRPVLRAIDCRIGPWREHMAEWNNFDLSSGQVKATPSLGNMPLVVISHDPGLGGTDDPAKSMNLAWDQMQSELANLSTRSSHIIATGSGHMIQQDRPDLVIAAIHAVVDESQSANATSDSR